MKSNLIFSSVINPGPQAEIDSLLLAASIRAFAGALAENPIWFFMPEYGMTLTEAGSRRLRELDVSVIPFKFEKANLQIFFLGQLAGLAQAEALGDGQAAILAWLDANTILLQEPIDFLLPAGISFGYRPVHHLLLGSCFDQPLDAFWTQVYQACQVPPERVFAMKPVVEDLQMRPYFNAGLLVTRPERGLLRQWYKEFINFYQAPEFQAFYRQDPRYSIFMHQAILAGVALRHLEQREMLELPQGYNYPVHLFDKDTTPRRPGGMDELISFRHEGFYEDEDWSRTFPASDRLKQWLAGALAGLHM